LSYRGSWQVWRILTRGGEVAAMGSGERSHQRVDIHRAHLLEQHGLSDCGGKGHQRLSSFFHIVHGNRLTNYPLAFLDSTFDGLDEPQRLNRKASLRSESLQLSLLLLMLFLSFFRDHFFLHFSVAKVGRHVKHIAPASAYVKG